jgi:lysophospholipase L1-like esterase
MYQERTDWVDTPKPPAKPGETPVKSADILRWERAHAEAHEQLDGRLSEATLNATYVPGGRVITRAGAVAIGDSMTAYNSPVGDPGRFGHVWWNLLGIASGGKLRFDSFFATAGFTIAQIRDTHLPSVLALNPKPGACFIMCGTNDIVGGGRPTAQNRTDYLSICDQLVAAGICPVILTIAPHADPNRSVWITAWNAWLRDLASRNGFPILDFNDILVDPATGGFRAGMVDPTDPTNIHPSRAGHSLIATAGAADAVFMARFPDGRPYLTRGINDSANLLDPYGLFLADSNSDGIPDGWTGALIAGTTASIVDDGKVRGKWLRLSKASGATGNSYVYRNISPGTPITGVAGAASTDVFTKTAHGLVEGDKVVFTTAVGGITRGVSYFVRDATANTFKVAATLGGAAVDVTADGTAVVAKPTLWEPGDTLRLAGRVRTSSAGAQPVLQVICQGAANPADKTYSPMYNNILAVLDGVAQASGPIPAGTHTLQVQIMLNSTATEAIDYDTGQVTLSNLSRLSIPVS